MDPLVWEGVRKHSDQTSLVVKDLETLGFDCSDHYTDEQAMEWSVYRLALVAQRAGVHGLICSPQEIAMLKREKVNLLTVTPGVRPEWTAANDQKRVMTPAEAIRAGADYLVVGRPITSPPAGLTRKEAARRILEEVVQASSSSS